MMYVINIEDTSSGKHVESFTVREIGKIYEARNVTILVYQDRTWTERTKRVPLTHRIAIQAVV